MPGMPCLVCSCHTEYSKMIWICYVLTNVFFGFTKTLMHMSDEVLSWLSNWSKVQIIAYCMPVPSRNPDFSASVQTKMVMTFLIKAYPGCHEREVVKWVFVFFMCVQQCPSRRWRGRSMSVEWVLDWCGELLLMSSFPSGLARRRTALVVTATCQQPQVSLVPTV